MNISLRIANYISRYAPSEAKILAYLEKKKCQNPRHILEEIGYNESMMMDMWMRSFLALGKGQREMTTKLMKKGFPKELISEKIDAYAVDIHDWESHRSSVINQIATLEQRGKSTRMIAIEMLRKYPYFREELDEILLSIQDTNNLTKEVQKYKIKYNIADPKEQRKFYAALLRKGFNYKDIKEQLITHY